MRLFLLDAFDGLFAMVSSGSSSVSSSVLSSSVLSSDSLSDLSNTSAGSDPADAPGSFSVMRELIGNGWVEEKGKTHAGGS